MSRERKTLVDSFGIYALAVCLILVATLAASLSGVIASYIQLIVAGIFLVIPNLIHRIRETEFDPISSTWRGTFKSLGLGIFLTAVTIGPFCVGFYVWKTEFRNETFDFEWQNFRQWSPKLEGKPSQWGVDRPGVWLWTKDNRLTVGLAGMKKAENSKYLRLRLESETPLQLARASQAITIEKEKENNRFVYRIGLTSPERTRLHFDKAFHEKPPDELKLKLESGSSIFLGARKQKTSDVYNPRRSYNWIWLWFLTHLIVIALPEEYFYRGYLQDKMRQFFQSREISRPVPLLNHIGITRENIATSLCFGVGHLLVPVAGAIQLQRISVFFPSIVFGWLYDRSESIEGAILYHAACNMMVLLAEPHFNHV